MSGVYQEGGAGERLSHLILLARVSKDQGGSILRDAALGAAPQDGYAFPTIAHCLMNMPCRPAPEFGGKMQKKTIK
jgi:hypothetical protein